MKLDLQSEISEEIIKIKNAHNHFITTLEHTVCPTQEELYKDDYQNRIQMQSPWMSPQITNYSAKERIIQNKSHMGAPTVNSTISEQIETLMKKIIEKPEQKALLLENFLIQFKELGEPDRMVLIESFKPLEQKKLREELEKLRDLFT